MSEQPVGEVTHYFNKISCAGVTVLAGRIAVGDEILITGHTTNLRQMIDSMQIEHVPVEEAAAGDQVGIKVVDRVRVGDMVYRVAAE